MAQRRITAFLAATLAVAGVTLSAMWAGGSAALAKDAPREIRIASVAYTNAGKTSYSGLSQLIDSSGWLQAELKKRGITLRWVPVPTSVGGPMINEGFANKSIDFAGYGDLPALIAKSAGIDISLLVPAGAGNNSYLVVRKDLSATSVTDLKGKRIALHRGRPWELAFSRLLDSRGLGLENFKVYNLNPQAGAAALAAGNVDAIYTLNDAFLLEDKGIGRIIWSTKQAPADWRMRAELFGRRAFIEENPELAQLVVTAYVKAAHWASDEKNRDAVIRVVARTGLPESVVRRDYDGDGVAWKDRWSPLFDKVVEDHYRHAVRFARDEKLIRRDVDPARLIDRRFVDKAIADLRLQDYWSRRPHQAVAAK